MIDSAVTGLERVFDRAFILGAFLPLLLFTVLSGLLAGVVSGRGASAVSAWEKAPGITQGLVLGGLVALVAAAAYLVAALQFSLLRIMEGYWPRRLGLERLRRLATGRHRRRWDRLAQAERTAAEQGRLAEQNGLQMLMAQQYPPRTRLDLMMPTRLGNILRAAEIYPHERYGIDAAVIWPRLRPLLPDTATAAMDDARAAIDAFLLLRFLSMVFGTFWPVLLLLSGHGWPLAALCLLSWAVAALAHRSALATAIAYGEQVKAAFDLHRHLLLTHLGLPVPERIARERALWDDLAHFYLRNLPFEHPVEPGPRAQ